MTAASVAVVVLAALAVLQVLVAAGRPYGRLVWGGRHEVLPSRLRIASAFSVVIYAGIAWTLLRRAESEPRGVVVAVTWALVGYFALGVAVNGISRSRPERLVMTPVCAVLLLCTLVLALSG